MRSRSSFVRQLFDHMRSSALILYTNKHTVGSPLLGASMKENKFYERCHYFPYDFKRAIIFNSRRCSRRVSRPWLPQQPYLSFQTYLPLAGRLLRPSPVKPMTQVGLAMLRAWSLSWRTPLNRVCSTYLLGRLHCILFEHGCRSGISSFMASQVPARSNKGNTEMKALHIYRQGLFGNCMCLNISSRCSLIASSIAKQIWR